MAVAPAVGFRFFSTEEELVSFYLRNQLGGMRRDMHFVIPVMNIYDVDPWDLPKLAGELCKGDKEQWFYFTPTQEKEAQGGRPNRTTTSGYWKVEREKPLVGGKSNGISAAAASPKMRHEFSLCRVYAVSGSARVFDRRPVEPHDNAATNAERATVIMEKTSSSATSHYGDDRYNPAEAGEDDIWEQMKWQTFFFTIVD
ncbi:Detected protein of unknown function [Hibiscus syriacus]|uniref:NAC domain-containing protein n=1 Tax=Hibiscus syriacus TaxID=106335 RepID=A0A6A2ZNG8_HIBSY|nr:Detected protein of unknown function [Hibiscus syriacus]